jgi:hypothetical protein
MKNDPEEPGMECAQDSSKEISYQREDRDLIFTNQWKHEYNMRFRKQNKHKVGGASRLTVSVLSQTL